MKKSLLLVVSLFVSVTTAYATEMSFPKFESRVMESNLLSPEGKTFLIDRVLDESTESLDLNIPILEDYCKYAGESGVGFFEKPGNYGLSVMCPRDYLKLSLLEISGNGLFESTEIDIRGTINTDGSGNETGSASIGIRIKF